MKKYGYLVIMRLFVSPLLNYSKNQSFEIKSSENEAGFLMK
ncbi:MAG TPA: hypothetical protein PKD83_03870 [Ignavibacteria bacterium]|nr:hypothetical protein [Ignavibacteria bacterium]